ncbi:hypothetical protein JOM56_013300 [Amanita muscaria]
MHVQFWAQAHLVVRIKQEHLCMFDSKAAQHYVIMVGSIASQGEVWHSTPCCSTSRNAQLRLLRGRARASRFMIYPFDDHHIQVGSQATETFFPEGQHCQMCQSVYSTTLECLTYPQLKALRFPGRHTKERRLRLSGPRHRACSIKSGSFRIGISGGSMI